VFLKLWDFYLRSFPKIFAPQAAKLSENIQRHKTGTKLLYHHAKYVSILTLHGFDIIG